MLPTRRARLESVIREEFSLLLTRGGLKDPRVQDLMVTKVEVTQDAGQATIFVNLFGALQEASEDKEAKMKDALTGLRSAAGFLRRHLAKALTIRHIPTLVFKEDKGLENTFRVEELLRQVKKDLPNNDE
jgi:ribosome-binding factor A